MRAGSNSSLPKTTVLVVEDSLSTAGIYKEFLRDEPLDVLHADTGKTAFSIIDEHCPRAILLDLGLPDMDGMQILEYVTERELPTSVVVITSRQSVRTAVDAMRAGAIDFIIKPPSADRVVVTLRNALERQRLEEIVETYREQFDRHEFCGFIGSSLPMQGVYRIIECAAPSKATVFITGESGTGKEVCAEAIHMRSPRRDASFIALNCAAIPAELIESEIFGHVKGAFTGAVSDREGAAARANGGTLFLDEICDMKLGLQAKLLRFIQTGTFQKVGETVTRKVDVRFLCATNRDPLEEVEAGRFREDLYYRVHVIPIHLPPVREREDDVVSIANHFLESFAKEEGKSFDGFAPDAIRIISAFAWPGNIRQLQNIIRNVVVLNPGGEVTAQMLPPPLNTLDPDDQTARLASPSASGVSRPATAGESPASIRPLWQVERDTIESAIRSCGGNVSQAAARLEINASTIYRKRQSWKGELGS